MPYARSVPPREPHRAQFAFRRWGVSHTFPLRQGNFSLGFPPRGDGVCSGVRPLDELCCPDRKHRFFLKDVFRAGRTVQPRADSGHGPAHRGAAFALACLSPLRGVACALPYSLALPWRRLRLAPFVRRVALRGARVLSSPPLRPAKAPPARADAARPRREYACR